MSSSRHVSDGLRQVAVAEKSNFIRTCNLLSRYIKEKGSLRDLNLEIEGKVENLEEIVNPGSSLAASKRNDSGKPGKQMDMSSQVSGPDCSIIEVEDSPNKTSTSKEDKRAQLTIFYSGKVLIFDDYPADKARELVSVAKRNSSQMSYGILPSIPSEKPSHAPRDGLPPRPQPARQQQQQSVGGGNACKEKTNSGPQASPSGLPPRPQSAAGCKEKSKQVSESNGSDLPIARRSSIHRFLEKRKDRAAGRGPYQNQGPEAAGSSSSYMGDQQLDLNL